MRLQTVVLIPSDDLRWTAVRAALHTMEQVEVIGEATSVAQALEVVTVLRPDMVIAAGTVDGVPARTFLTEMRRICGPMMRLAVLATAYDPGDVVPFALIRLAAYYLWDDLTVDTLDCCLATVLKSPMFVGSPAVMDALVAALEGLAQQAGATTTTQQESDLPERLTPRERQLLDAIARGWSNARIADELCLKNQTVRRYISDLCAKIGVESHYEAIVWAKDRGFGAS